MMIGMMIGMIVGWLWYDSYDNRWDYYGMIVECL